MGWWPFSSSDPSPTTSAPNDTTPEPTKRDFSLTNEQHQRIFGRPRPDSGSSPSRDEQADTELHAFLKEIGAPALDPSSPDTTTSPTTTPPTPAQNPNTDASGRAIHPDGSLDITPSALLPRSMSCRQAFDQAFYCQSLGGKFNDIYRHGQLRSCSEQWGAFWFCMRVRGYGEADKQEVIKEYYRDRDEKRKAEFGSSEDVWEIRTKGVERAFWRDPMGEEGEVAVKE